VVRVTCVAAGDLRGVVLPDRPENRGSGLCVVALKRPSVGALVADAVALVTGIPVTDGTLVVEANEFSVVIELGGQVDDALVAGTRSISSNQEITRFLENRSKRMLLS
jgi:Zn-dependent metalloprotease